MAAQETISNLGQGLQGRVGLSVPSGYGQMVMSDWLVEFKRLYPGIVLDVVFENRIDNLRDEVDIAIRILPEPPPQMVAREFGTVRYLACASQAYVTAHGLPTELAQLRAAKPDAVYFFLPGAMGINFIKQFVGAGLSKDITLVTSGFSSDEDVIGAVGEPMLGLFNTTHWAHDLDNAANKAFVAAFRKEYGGRYPSLYAAQAYDVIMAMDAAVKATGGKVSDKEALTKAIAKAQFPSVRGNFRYANNHFPVQNFYLRSIGKNAEGRVTNKTIRTVLENYGDAYAAQCKLK